MTTAQPHVLLPLAGLALLLSTPALAQDAETSTMLAIGGAGAAHAHDNGAITVNPAAVGLTRRYRVDIIGGFWDGNSFRAGLSAVDAGYTSPNFALGVAYQHWASRSPLSTDELPGWRPSGEELSARRNYNSIALAGALPVADGRFSVGVSGTLLIIRHNILGPTLSGDMDVGLAGRPVENWSLGVAVRNLLPRFFPTDERIGLTAGTRYAWNELTSVALDVDVPFTPTDGVPVSIRGGAEIGQDLRHLGVGYRFEGPVSEHWLSVGGGLWSDTAPESPGGNLAGLHYAAQFPLHGMGSTRAQLLGIRHTLTLSIQPKKSKGRR